MGDKTESSYDGDMDFLFGFIDKMEDPNYFDNWSASLDEPAELTYLPAFAPCLSHFRLLKTCIRKTKHDSALPCAKQLSELEHCSAEFFHELNIKLPSGSCENEMTNYFTAEIENLTDLKSAKKHWMTLFECSKTKEADEILKATRFAQQQQAKGL